MAEQAIALSTVESLLPPEATPELHAALDRRRRIIEGKPQPTRSVLWQAAALKFPGPATDYTSSAASKTSGGGQAMRCQEKLSQAKRLLQPSGSLGSLQQQTKVAMERMEAQVVAIRQQHSIALQELNMKCSREVLKRDEMTEEISKIKQKRTKRSNTVETEQQTELETSDAQVQVDVQVVGVPPDQQQQQQENPSAEGALRSALTRTGVTTDELQVAIESVEALLGEAKRELQRRRFRERRAAYECLHTAMVSANEDSLVAALAEARRAGVEEEDLTRGGGILQELRSLTAEERLAKLRREREAQAKSRAFLLVKRNQAAELQEHLSSIDDTAMQWQAWKDHAGRTLLQFACTIHADKTRPLLEALIDLPAQACSCSTESESTVALSESCPMLSGSRQNSASSLLGSSSEDSCSLQAASTEDSCCLQEPAPPQVLPMAPEATATPAKEDAPSLKTAAFRAVVQDDIAALGEIIGKVPLSTWRDWKNKCDKDLLMLSEERGSMAAYSMLAKAMGLVKERRRESFEEREAVWVMLPGEVQPRRATVLLDTPEEAQIIFVEFWEGDEAPANLDRDVVFKSNN